MGEAGGSWGVSLDSHSGMYHRECMKELTYYLSFYSTMLNMTTKLSVCDLSNISICTKILDKQGILFHIVVV